MDTQCNACGSFENLHFCEHCAMPVCTRCAGVHTQGCTLRKKMEAAGAGPTVRPLYSQAVPKADPRVFTLAEKIDAALKD
jgi:hypothetical protein